MQFIGACTQPPNLCIVTGKSTRIFKIYECIIKALIFYLLELMIDTVNRCSLSLDEIDTQNLLFFYKMYQVFLINICKMTWLTDFNFLFLMFVFYQNSFLEGVYTTFCINIGVYLSFHLCSK